LEPPSSSEESGTSLGATAWSLRYGIHSIRPASGIFTIAANNRTQTHRGIWRWYYCRVRTGSANGRGDGGAGLDELAERISACRRCPRLVAWREQVARERRAAFATEEYWGRPLPGFGDPRARVLLLGLAPAAHGANRTGRVFTGDRSGDFLFAALWRTGFANQALSRNRDDGLRLTDAWITAAVRCAPPANRPSPAERERCLPWSAAELKLLSAVRVVVCLGAFAWDAALRLMSALAEPDAVPLRPRPRFAHGGELERGRYRLLGCYHPSQQNTFTGKLTEPMIDAVLARARELAGGPR
jgi:uracil-DNA glycosylase family 4